MKVPERILGGVGVDGLVQSLEAPELYLFVHYPLRLNPFIVLHENEALVGQLCVIFEYIMDVVIIVVPLLLLHFQPGLAQADGWAHLLQSEQRVLLHLNRVLLATHL